MSTADFLSDLRWRGLLHQATHEDALAQHLATCRRTAYVGFDPTADSLTIGNLVPLLMLARFQRAGHRPIAVVGGGTGLIGDPSGKSAERQLLTPDDVALHPVDNQLLAVAIESHRRFSAWAADIHQHPVTVYLAGAVQSPVAAGELLEVPIARPTTPSPSSPAVWTQRRSPTWPARTGRSRSCRSTTASATPSS